MKGALSLVAFTLLWCLMSSVADSTIALAQLVPLTASKWAFDSGSIVGGNPADTNVAASSTHVCITTRAGFKCFTKSGTRLRATPNRSDSVLHLEARQRSYNSLPKL
jgi:hypothetical protein